jgi:excisionase family DNA binding protein
LRTEDRVDYITLTKASELTGIESSTFRHAIRDCKLKAIKPGHDYLVTLDDVQAYMDEHSVKPRRRHKRKTSKREGD